MKIKYGNCWLSTYWRVLNSSRKPQSEKRWTNKREFLSSLRQMSGLLEILWLHLSQWWRWPLQQQRKSLAPVEPSSRALYHCSRSACSIRLYSAWTVLHLRFVLAHRQWCCCSRPAKCSNLSSLPTFRSSTQRWLQNNWKEAQGLIGWVARFLVKSIQG